MARLLSKGRSDDYYDDYDMRTRARFKKKRLCRKNDYYAASENVRAKKDYSKSCATNGCHFYYHSNSNGYYYVTSLREPNGYIVLSTS